MSENAYQQHWEGTHFYRTLVIVTSILWTLSIIPCYK